MRLRRIARGELPTRTAALAQALIGCVLVRDCPDGRAAGRIIEVEGYTADDPASHSFRGKTQRNAAMFMTAHHAYVYFIYGSSFCFNVTSEAGGVGGAVLVRALEPLDGISLMERRRRGAPPRDLCRGPGRLCAALGIDRACDGIDLLSDRGLWLAAAVAPAAPVGRSVRIGLTRAAARPMRFYEAGNPFVSGPRSLRT